MNKDPLSQSLVSKSKEQIMGWQSLRRRSLPVFRSHCLAQHLPAAPGPAAAAAVPLLITGEASHRAWRDSLTRNDSNSLSQLLIEAGIAIFLSDLWIPAARALL